MEERGETKDGWGHKVGSQQGLLVPVTRFISAFHQWLGVVVLAVTVLYILGGVSSYRVANRVDGPWMVKLTAIYIDIDGWSKPIYSHLGYVSITQYQRTVGSLYLRALTRDSYFMQLFSFVDCIYCLVICRTTVRIYSLVYVIVLYCHCGGV